MLVQPFQNLFIQKELTSGSAGNSILNGRAVFDQIDFFKFSRCLNNFIANSQWAYLHLSECFTFWIIKDHFGGCLNIEEQTSPSKISLNCLWEISFFKNGDGAILDVAMHHAFADAHTFQLFWTGIISEYNEKKYLITNPHYPINSFQALYIPNIKLVENNGLGPIERKTISFSAFRKNQFQKMANAKAILLSTALISVLQAELDYVEKYLGLNLQAGFALRNRSGRNARASFLTAVNFLPVTHYPITKIKDLEAHIKQLFRHQDYPLIQWLRDNNRSMAFNVLFSYQKQEYDAEQGAELIFLPAPEDETILGVHVLDFGDGDIKISFDFRTDIADQSFWRAFIVQYLNAISLFLNDSALNFEFKKSSLPPKYTHKSLWSNFDIAPSERKALICNGETITFGELRATLVAMPCPADPIIFIEPDRSLNSILLILKAWKENKIVAFSPPKEVIIPEGDFLYLAQTSGSTGEPKTIFISRAGIESMLDGWQKQLNISPSSVHLSTADQQFDVFFGDLFRSIFLGTTMVLASKEEQFSPISISDLLVKNSVTHYESTPSLLLLLTSKLNALSNLKALIIGSEPLTYQLLVLIKKISNAGLKVFNSYGLTEVSIDSALAEINTSITDYFPVGFPLGDQCFKVINDQFEIVPIGIWGELVIKGKCVGRILGSDQKNLSNGSDSEFFTGDRAMIHPNFGLIVNGRLNNDFIKVHGKRIPTSALESFILMNTDATNCFVFEKKGLVILSHNAKTEDQVSINKLATKFQRHQIPDIILKIDDWQLNKNGKVDKEKIKDTIVLPINNGIKWRPSSEKNDVAIANIFHKIGKDWGDKEESLYFYGWNSIDLLSFCNELFVQGYSISAAVILRDPTIATILQQIKQKTNDAKKITPSISVSGNDLDEILKILNG